MTNTYIRNAVWAPTGETCDVRLGKYGNLLSAKDHGRVRQEGRDYVVQDGDIIHFKFNV